MGLSGRAAEAAFGTNGKENGDEEMCDLSKRAGSQEIPLGRRMSGAAPKTDRNAVRLTAEERKEIAEIVRLLTERPRQFRLQFLSGDGAADEAVRDEVSVWALDASTAASMAAEPPLPEGATRLRVVDSDGQTVFERETIDA